MRHRLLRFIAVVLLGVQYRPYVVAQASTSEWQEIPPSWLPLSCLRASHRTRSDVVRDKQIQIESGRRSRTSWSYSGDEYPLVALFDGEFWIVDGHHRVKAFKRDGARVIRVRVAEAVNG